MIWATLEYEWVDWEGNLIGHYSDGSDHILIAAALRSEMETTSIL